MCRSESFVADPKGSETTGRRLDEREWNSASGTASALVSTGSTLLSIGSTLLCSSLALEGVDASGLAGSVAHWLSNLYNDSKSRTLNSRNFTRGPVDEQSHEFWTGGNPQFPVYDTNMGVDRVRADKQFGGHFLF